MKAASDVTALEELLRQACLLECSARKPGNVSPAASFADLTIEDFRKSAPITARRISQASAIGVGPSVEAAARQLKHHVGKNTHLGILLLLAPLSAAAGQSCSVLDVLSRLSVEDAESVYRAIGILQPGGLGEVDDQDVSARPTETLLECMRLAADRDTIARQYTNRFADVFEFAGGLVAAGGHISESAIVRLHLQLMSRFPDTLIARKCGQQVAEESAARAVGVLADGVHAESLRDFDAWLRADGNRRNPGTTADMVAAILFVALWNQAHPDRPLR